MRRSATFVGAVLSCVGLMGGPAVAATASDSGPQTAYQLPFRCSQSWTGTTRPDHSPSPNAIDFNRQNDFGQPVTAAAPGVVTIAKNLGNTSYGRYVVIDHGNGETSLYAHLKAMWVVAGETVDQGQTIGQVGSSGNSTGAHLHFEERSNGTDVPEWFDGAAYTPGTTIASRNCVDVPVVGDWDGDGISDIGVYRRSRGAGRFLRLVGGTTSVLKFGPSYEQPLVGDWDGDGVSDVGYYLAQKHVVEMQSASGAVTEQSIGGLRDRIVVGDWNGDGTDQLGVWRPRRAAFGIPDSSGKLQWVQLGTKADLPVVGDWNGDGISDLGVFDPTTATWTLRYVDSQGLAWTSQTTFGQPGDLPVVGDWNGDGISDLGTWTPSTAVWTRQGVDSPATTSSDGTTTAPTGPTYGRPRS